MKKTRIIKRTYVDGIIEYIIQVRHFLLKFLWVDAWVNTGDPWTDDSYSTLKQAKENLCYFDGSEIKNRIVYQK